MSLILLEGLDRTGKSSLAEHFKSEGYEVIHLSAPSKKYKEPGYTGPSYLDDMMDLLQQAATKDIVLDRTHYGELIWPTIYGRDAMLSEEDIETLREMEDAVGVKRILMHDPDMEAHWKRCVDNNEPLTRPQFLRARTLYERMAKKYGFEKTTLTEVPGFEDIASAEPSKTATPVAQEQPKKESTTAKSKEQIKLEKANAINDVLSKRIIKSKGGAYDEIESEIRAHLNKSLGIILGSEQPDSFSKDEMALLRALVTRLKEKGAN
jgi:hypothetical protein